VYIWQHFKTITKHRMLVCKNCFKVGLYRQGLTHDLSKYSWTEFSKGCKYWQGDRSPNNAEREDTGISLAWLHHKGRNKHHFEYWIDYDVESPNLLGGMKIPEKYVAEMIMDRIAACMVYMGDRYTDAAPYEYYMRGKEHLWFVHEECREQLEFLLGMLKDQVEKKTFHYMKHVFLKKPWKESRAVIENTV
jgi:hypothetical protein